MPTARECIDIDLDMCDRSIDVEIEFQLWCAECGNGICGNTEYMKRSFNHFTTYCEKCKKEKEEVKSELSEANDKITSLEDEIESLKQEVRDLQNQL